MGLKLLVSKSKLDNTLQEYDKVYNSVLTWKGRMEKENSDVVAADSGTSFVTYGESTSAYINEDVSEFSGHVNIMRCALTEALSKTNSLIARSEDFVNVLRGEGAMDSDSYAGCSSSGDLATFYDDHCPEEAGYEGNISMNTKCVLDLGVMEEKSLVNIENELSGLSTINVSIDGQASHIRDCIEKQNYTDPLLMSLKSYGYDVKSMNDYVVSMKTGYFPATVGAREHARTYNYDGAPTGDKESIYFMRLRDMHYSYDDIKALKQYTGLTSEQLFKQLSNMPVSEASKLLTTAYKANGNSGAGGSTGNYEEYHTGNKVVDAEIDRLFNEYGPDLEGIRYDINWDECPDVTKHALAVIFDNDMAKINNSFSDAEVADEERAVSNILVLLHDGYPEPNNTVLDQEKLKSFTTYLKNDISIDVINKMANITKNETGWTVNSLAIANDVMDINVRVDKAGVLIEYVDLQHEGEHAQIAYHTNDDRSLRYVQMCEAQNPGCFDHEYGVLKLSGNADRQVELAKLYSSAQNEYDTDLFDKLFKSDSKYKDVFTTDPEKLSSEASLVLAQHSLLLTDNVDEYINFAKALVNNGDYTSEYNLFKGYNHYGQKYVEILTVGSALLTDQFCSDALKGDYTSEEDMQFALTRASQNELFWKALYGMSSKFDDITFMCGIDITVNKNGADVDGFDFLGNNSFSISYSSLDEGPDQKKTVQLITVKDGTAVFEMTHADIVSLEEKKKKAAQDILITTAIDITSIYCKPLGIGMKLLNNAKNSNNAALAKQGINATVKKANEVQGTLLGELVDLYSKISDIEAQIKKKQDVIDATWFGTVMEYKCGNDIKYYVELNDLKKIKAINALDDQGFAAFYNDKDMASYDSRMQSPDIMNTIIADTRADNKKLKNYTDEEIKEAVYAIYYGVNNDKNPYKSDEAAYNSVLDIPAELRNAIIHVLNVQKPDSVEEGFIDAFNDYAKNA